MPDREPTWHPEVLPTDWERAAKELAARSVLEGFYLAGGTGLALQLGHRRSVDLDLFRQTEFASERVRDQLRDLKVSGDPCPASRDQALLMQSRPSRSASTVGRFARPRSSR